MLPDLTVLILDDEQLAIARMRDLLRRISGISQVVAAENGYDGLRLVAEVRPDIVLLDVEMPGMSGIEFLDKLPPGRAPAVIFVTAFDRYAIGAFERHAVQYVLKPVALPKLAAAIADARQAIAHRRSDDSLADLRGQLRELGFRLAGRDPWPQQIPVPDRKGLRFLPVHRIDHIAAEGDYVRILSDDGSFLVRQTLAKLEKSLDPRDFQRVHRSTLVRLGAIAGLLNEKYGGLAVQTRMGGYLKVGRSYRSALAKQIASRTP